MIYFLHPGMLIGWAFIPLILWLRKKGWGKPASFFYPEVGAVTAAFKGGRRPGSGSREMIRLATIGLLILAGSRPQQLLPEKHLFSRGLDIILMLDISGSMSARDFEPLNRLQAAKTVLREFLAQEDGDRLGLIAFAARAFMVCPLTLDYHVLLLMLDHLEIGMTSDGTAIGMAITAGLNRLKYSRALSKVIILLTDGRNNAGQVDILTAAEMAAALKVRIYTIGMGEPQGGPILVKDPHKGETFLLNADGSVHIETIDEGALKKIADRTGGKYFRATDQDKLKAIYEEIRRMETARLEAKAFTTRRDWGLEIILFALLLLGGEILLLQTLERRIP